MVSHRRRDDPSDAVFEHMRGEFEQLKRESRVRMYINGVIALTLVAGIVTVGMAMLHGEDRASMLVAFYGFVGTAIAGLIGAAVKHLDARIEGRIREKRTPRPGQKPDAIRDA